MTNASDSLRRFGALSETLARRYGKRSNPTLLREIEEARSALTLRDELVMALRAHRRRLSLSQRAYAETRGWGRGFIARLEADPTTCRLQVLQEALAGTGYRLALVRDDPDGPGGVSSDPREVGAEEWAAADLVARTGGGSRFPAHQDVHRTEAPWWFARQYQCWAAPPPGPAWTAVRRR